MLDYHITLLDPVHGGSWHARLTVRADYIDGQALANLPGVARLVDASQSVPDGQYVNRAIRTFLVEFDPLYGSDADAMAALDTALRGYRIPLDNIWEIE